MPFLLGFFTPFEVGGVSWPEHKSWHQKALGESQLGSWPWTRLDPGQGWLLSTEETVPIQMTTLMWHWRSIYYCPTRKSETALRFLFLLNFYTSNWLELFKVRSQVLFAFSPLEYTRYSVYVCWMQSFPGQFTGKTHVFNRKTNLPSFTHLSP